MTPTERYLYQRKLKQAAYFRQYRANRRAQGLDIPVRVGHKITTKAALKTQGDKTMASHLVARALLERRIEALKQTKKEYEEAATNYAEMAEGNRNMATEADQEINILVDTLGAMEMLV